MSPEAQTIFYLIAFILFILAAAGVPSRVWLVPAGLAFWVFVLLYTAFKASDF